VLVLVATSDAALRALLADAVRAAGHDVVPAGDGASAWAAYVAHRPPLLIVDIMLAAGAGADAGDALGLCARVAAERPADPAEGVDPTDPADAAQAPWAGSVDVEPDDAPDPFMIVAVPGDGAGELQRALDAGADDYLVTPPAARTVAARLSIAERRMRQAVARRRAERGLRRARWLAGIGETSIALQHEINNPLAALLGHAALLEEGLVAPEEEAETLQVVVEQAHRIANVVKRLAALRDPRSVAYLGGARMIDLSRAGLPPEAAPLNGASLDGAGGPVGGDYRT
jgi:DNA-binding response OmpR family regulator